LAVLAKRQHKKCTVTAAAIPTNHEEPCVEFGDQLCRDFLCGATFWVGRQNEALLRTRAVLKEIWA
jgi:hypothetical protein